MFRRKGYGYGGGPISTLISSIISAIIVIFLLYIAYKVFIVGDGINADGVTEVFSNILKRGVEIGKSIADYIINLFSGGGPKEIAPESTGEAVGVIVE